MRAASIILADAALAAVRAAGRAEDLPPIRWDVSFGGSLSAAGIDRFRFTTIPGLALARDLALDGSVGTSPYLDATAPHPTCEW